jgi:hypothetical protein
MRSPARLVAAVSLVLLVCLVAAAGCANSDATLGVARVTLPPAGTPVTLKTDVQPIFTAQCATAFCHGTPLGGPMSLEDGKSYGALVGVASTESPLPRVTGGDSNMSYLIHKLEGTQNSVGGGGDRMPPGGPPLPQPEIQLIRDWIEQGAKDN